MKSTLIICFRNIIIVTSMLLLAYSSNAQCGFVATPGPVSCNGGADGKIVVTVTSGAPNYSWRWIKGIDTVEYMGPSIMTNKFDIPMLTAGNYKVTVTTGSGCTHDTMNVIVAQPVAITVTNITPVATTCGLNNGSINITVAGGTPNYTFNWSGPSGYSSTLEDISGLASGDYFLMVTDSKGCTKEVGPIAVGASTGVTITLDNVTNVTCNGLVNGQIFISVMGAGPNYTYNWSHNPPGQDPQDPSNLAAGTYSVTVTSGVCTSTYPGISVTQPPVLTVSITPTNGSCGMSSSNGAMANPGGGTGPYTYLWSYQNQTTQSINNIPANTYTVTVTDANGCPKTSTVSIMVGSPLQISLTGNPPQCHNGTNGSVTVAITSGASTPYSIAWSGQSSGSTTSVSIPPNYSISNLSPGNYTVTVTGMNGCSSVTSTNITNPAALTITAGTVQSSCPVGTNNNPANGSVQLTVTGGTPSNGAYNYSWSGNGSANQKPANYTITGLTPQIYTITVTDANNCPMTTTATVGTYSLPTLTAVATSPTCATANASNGNNVNGKVDLSISGGISLSANPFLWSNNAITQNISNLGPSSATYTVTVTDINQCKSTASASITAPLVMTANMIGSGGYCAGSGGSAELIVNVTNGVASYTVEINPAIVKNNYISGASIPVTPTSTTNYSLTKVTDFRGCIASGSNATGNFTVNVTPTLNVSVTVAASKNPICFGENVTFTASPQNGGSAPQLQWFRIHNNLPIQLTPLQANNTLITRNDLENGDFMRCILKSNITCPANGKDIDTFDFGPMVVHVLPEVESFTPAKPFFCIGEEIQFNASAKNAGMAPYDFSITPESSNNPVATSSGNPANQLITITGPTANTSGSFNYTLRIKDAFLCTSNISTFQSKTSIVVRLTPQKPTGNSKSACWNPSGTSSYPTLAVAPTANTEYKWNTNPNGPFETTPFPTGTSLSSTTYGTYLNGGNNPGTTSFWVKSLSQGCYSIDPTELTIILHGLPEKPEAVENLVQVCQTAPADVMEVMTAGSNITFNWYLNGNIQPDSNTNILTPAQEGSFSIRAKNKLTGCLSSEAETIVFERWKNPKANYSVAPSAAGQVAGSIIVFLDESVKGSNSGSINKWEWDFGSTTVVPSSSLITTNPDTATNVERNYPDPGDYNVCLKVTDENSCNHQYCDILNIANPTDCRVQFSPSKIEVCEGDVFTIKDFTAKASDSGGLIDTWKWEKPSAAILIEGDSMGFGNNISEPTFRIDAAGDYIFRLMIKDSRLPDPCSATGLLSVKVKPKPSASLISPDNVCSGTQTMVVLNLSGEKPFDFKYTINNLEVPRNGINTSSYLIPIEGSAVPVEIKITEIKSGNGCTNSVPNAIDTISIWKLPFADSYMDSCLFNSNQYQFSIIANGGSAPYLVNNLPVDTFFSGNIQNGTIFPVIIQDANGCIEKFNVNRFCNCTEEVVASQVFQLTNLNSVTENQNVCEGDEIKILCINPTDTLPSGYEMYFYLYSGSSISDGLLLKAKPQTGLTPGAAQVVHIPYPSDPLLFNVPYYLEGILARTKDGKPDLEGCFMKTNETFTRVFRKRPSAQIVNSSVCEGSTSVITFKFSENPRYKFRYSVIGSSLIDIDDESGSQYTTPAFSVSTPNAPAQWPVKLFITGDAYGCRSMDTIMTTLNVLPRPSFTIETEAGNADYCKGDTVTLSAVGNPVWNYAWSGLGNNQSVEFEALATQTYTLTVTDNTTQLGCSAKNSIQINVKENPEPKLVAQVTEFCQNVYNPTYSFVNIGTDNVPAADYKWELYNSNSGIQVPVPIFNAKDRFGDDDAYFQKDTIFIDWSNIPKGDYRLYLKQKLKISSSTDKTCPGESFIDIKIDAQGAPDRTGIVRFEVPVPTLRAQIPNLCYQWGYTLKTNSPNNNLFDQADVVSASQFRDYTLPSGDLNGLLFWVDTWKKNDQGQCAGYAIVKDFCATRSYSEDPDFVNNIVEPDSANLNFLIIPNPNHGVFSLFIKNCLAGSARLRVFDFNGKLIGEDSFEITEPEQMAQFALKNIPSGQYFVQLIMGNGKTITKKMIVNQL